MTNTAQTSIILTICKIFNWEETQASTHFDIHIYSAKTTSLLLSKSIKAVFSRNQAIFNYSLKVNYPSDENQILIKLGHLAKMTNSMNNIAQFTLNLDNLRTKKMQFFPFGKNDKVLKISVGEQQKQQLAYKTRFNQQNYNFIQEKEEFLKKIASNTSTSRANDNSRSKKSFSQKAKNLLSEVKTIKQQKNTQRNEIEQEFRDYYQEQDRSDYMKINLQQVKRVNKSNSERAFLSPKTGRREISKNRREEDYEKRSNRSQKHKLALKSLEMVACQNQYYEESEYNDGDRRASMMPQKKIPALTRLIKSQLY